MKSHNTQCSISYYSQKPLIQTHRNKYRFFSAIIAIKMYKQRVHIVRKIVEDAATFNSHTIALSVLFYAQTAKTLSDKSRSYCARLSCILKSNHK